MKTKAEFVAGAICILLLGGCDTMGMGGPGNTASSSVSSGNGVVQSIELVQQGSSGIGAGTIAGGVVGGILGNQIGGGSGNTVATIGGAAAGAYVGHELEKRRQTDAYKFTIRMDNGSMQTLTQSSAGNFRVGDRVRIENGVLQRR